jgi:hypothetical protein
MSRHCISRNPLEIIVGWDPPLQTYFLQITDPTKDEENQFVLWCGTYPDELPTTESLADVLAPYAVLTLDLREQLEDEKARSPQPTELQRRMIEMFS